LAGASARPVTHLTSWQDDQWLTETVTSAQEGDQHAFEAIVLAIGPPVYRFLVLRLGHEGDARDALQETLIAAWQGIGSLKRPASFRSWVLTIAARKATLISRARRTVLTLSEPEMAAAEPRHEDSLAIKIALESLPSSLRDVLLLRHVVGLTEAETALVLDVRVGTVKSRASRGRRRIAASIEEASSQ
jgi:RNA polymerase sigma-70 factor (ECF subfamily)